MKVQIEEVSPSQAEAWLKLSKGNRAINQNYVLSLAVALEEGRWVPEASDVVFDSTGALIDGHHRLHAVMAYEAPAKLCVKRGVPPEARNVIDTGRTRNIPDLLAMYRTVEYANWRRSSLNMSVRLLMGNGTAKVQIRDLNAWDNWMKVFREGIDWVIGSTLQADLSKVSSTSFGTGPILGAFAFAHKLNPEGVAKFHTAAVRGEGLANGDPALTLRNAVLHERGTRNLGGQGRWAIAIKTLCAIYAELHGQKMHRLNANSEALPFFRSAYKSRSVAALVEPWETKAAPPIGDGAMQAD